MPYVKKDKSMHNISRTSHDIIYYIMYRSRDMIIGNIIYNYCIILYNHEHNIRQYVHFYCLNSKNSWKYNTEIKTAKIINC